MSQQKKFTKTLLPLTVGLSTTLVPSHAQTVKEHSVPKHDKRWVEQLSVSDLQLKQLAAAAYNDNWRDSEVLESYNVVPLNGPRPRDEVQAHYY